MYAGKESSEEDSKEKELYIRDTQLLIKQKFDDKRLMEWLDNTTGYDKPFPDEQTANWKAQGQRELVITIKNMISMSPDEIIEYFKKRGKL